MKVRKERFWELHWPLIGLIVLVAGLGVYNLHSAAAAKNPDLYWTQLSWLGVGAVVVVMTMAVDYRLSENLAYLVYGLICVLLLAVLLFGTKAGGAQRWISLGSFRFQPSELAKIATILCLARYFGPRVKEGGYSLSELFRPLNISRPLLVVGVVVVCWNKAWMLDPVGELARWIHTTMGGALFQVEDLMWFRCFCLVMIFVCSGGLIWSIVRASQAQALLNPWPPLRRRRLIGGVVIVGTLALCCLAWFWDWDWLRDPFATLMNFLSFEGGSGGMYRTLGGGWWLRGTLSALVALYGIISILSFRRWKGPLIDLMIAPIDLLALPALLILVEPDLGTAGIVVFIGMTMIFVVGIKAKSIAILGVLGSVVAVVGWFGVLKDYQKRRILTFIDPENDIHGAGWNAIQSLIAVGSGRWFGQGHKGGTQTRFSFLPEQHTDFAFSVWAEEQGFVGCTILLALYLLLLIMAFAIAAEARETYGALLAVGVAALILWQTLINVGMVIGVAPVVGMTLPLFCYGGSSIITTMLGLGLLLNVHWRCRSTA
ncbi:MAG: FtsW/RodA/SpoVE family cell cycle protein [Myxococcota bacterium]|nr:FtsW/RodA/SpoVE family cell cycle protein [Myxococcota bacterium]